MGVKSDKVAMSGGAKKIKTTELEERYKEASSLSQQSRFADSNDLLLAFIDESIEDKELLSNIRHLMGFNAWKAGRHEEAASQYSDALTLMRDMRLYTKLPSVVNLLGLYHRKSGHYRDALVYFLEGLFYAFRLDDKAAMVAITANMAMVMMELHDYDRSERGYDAALRLCSQVSGQRDIGAFRCEILINKCLLSFYQGLTQRIPGILSEIEGVIAHQDMGVHTPEIRTFMAHSYTQVGEYGKAYNLLKDQNLFDTHVVNVPYVIDLISMGEVSRFLLDDDALSLRYMHRALALSEANDMFQTKLLAHNALLQHYKAIGDEKLASFHEEQYKKVREGKSAEQEVSYLTSMLDANLDAVEDRSKHQEKIDDLLSEHDFLINTYTYQYRKITYHIPLRDIAYVEVRRDYLHIFTVSDPDLDRFEMVQAHQIRKPLKDFVAEVSGAASYFVRIHGSFLVNLLWVSKFPQKNLKCILIGTTELTISDTYRPIFKEKLNAFLASFPS